VIDSSVLDNGGVGVELPAAELWIAVDFVIVVKLVMGVGSVRF